MYSLIPALDNLLNTEGLCTIPNLFRENVMLDCSAFDRITCKQKINIFFTISSVKIRGCLCIITPNACMI